MSFEVRKAVEGSQDQDSERQSESLSRQVERLKRNRFRMLGIFCFFLVLSVSLFIWDLTQKSHDQAQRDAIELFQYSCNVVLNLIIAICLLICTRNFFVLLKERFGGHM